MTDTYPREKLAQPTAEATPTHFEPAAGTITAVGDMVLKPLEWAAEFQKLALDYMGEPEQVYFMNAARRFAALARALPPPEAKPDGFVVLGDID